MGRRIALLIGNGDYESLPKLQTPKNNIEKLHNIFLDKNMGFFDEVEILIDKNSTEIKRKISDFLKNAEHSEEVLIYYAGHGVRTDDLNNICLSGIDTPSDDPDIASIDKKFIFQKIKQSPSKQIALIIDACFSGDFTKGTHFSTNQTVEILTSTGATEYSYEPTETKDNSLYTYFTNLIINAIENGKTGNSEDQFLTIKNIIEYIKENRTTSQISPKISTTTGDSDSFKIAKNIKNSPQYILDQHDVIYSLDELKQQFKRFSAELLSWSTTLGKDKSYILQPELQNIINLIEEKETSITVLLGQPGCGKSTLLAKLGLNFESKDVSLLAIKTDQLPADIKDLKQIFSTSDVLPETADTCLKTIAKNGKTLLLLDQVDALADLSDLKTERLNRILDLVYSLLETPNLHIVISCREFEFKHDSRLRRLDKYTSITLALPSWKDICIILQKNKLDVAKINSFPKEIKEELLIPQYLNIYLAIYNANSTNLHYFDSYQLMLQKLWETKIKEDCEQFINNIAEIMSKKEELWLPLSDFVKNTDQINELIALDILVKNQSEKKLSFRHQTYFDFAHARNFINQKNSLFDYVKSRQNSLFLRPKLWQIIHYLRNAELTRYHQELTQILDFKELRIHVKQLLIEFIGQVSKPSEIEQQWVLKLLDSQHCDRMINAMVGNDHWFYYIEKTCLVDLIKKTPVDLPALPSLLKEAPSEFYVMISELLQTHWLNCKTYDWNILFVLKSTHKDNPLSFDIVLVIMKRNINEFGLNISQFLEKALPVDEERGFKLLTQYLDLKLSEVIKNNNKINSLFDDGLELYWLYRSKSPLIKNYSFTLLKVTIDWLHKVFKENNITQFFHGIHYNKTHLYLKLPQDKNARNKLLEAMDTAIKILAKEDPERYQQIIKRYGDSDWRIIQRLLTRGICYFVSENPKYVLNFLLADPRRFYLGTDSTPFKETILLIKKLSPYLQKNQLSQLINYIKEYSFYDNKFDSPEQKRIRIKINRKHRLILYSSIPDNYQPPSLKKLIAEEKRAFPNYKKSENYLSFEFEEISYISLDNMKQMGIPELINLFSNIPDSYEWDHPKDWNKSGAIHLSRTFGEMAKLMPEKAIDIIKQLPKTHQLYVSQALNGISESDYSCSKLYDLIIQLIRKGFNSQKYFQFNILNVLEHCLKKREKPPQEILYILIHWLETNVISEPENNDIIEKEEEGSLLRHYIKYSLLSEVTRLLRCIFYICWFEKPFKKVTWFKSLKIHLAKKDHWETWLLLFNPCLKKLCSLDNQQETENFLIALFLTHPKLLENKIGLQFLASSLGWISNKTMDNWLIQLKNKPQPLSQQAYGELIMIRYLRFQDNPKYLQNILLYVPLRKQVDQKIKSSWLDIFLYKIKLFKKNNINIETGCAYSLAHYWSEKKLNNIIPDILLKQFLLHQSSQVKKASREVYYNIISKKGSLINQEEWKLLELLSQDFESLQTEDIDFLFERLENNIPQNPKIVIKLVNCFLSDLKKSNEKRNNCLIGEELIAISHRLQRLPAYSSDGLDIFEKLINLNLYGVNTLLDDIDRYRKMVK